MAITFGAVEVRDPSRRALAVAYRAFSAVIASQVIATTSETPLMLIKNPSTNNVPMTISRRRVASLVASQSAIFKFYANPTVSANGTAVTPQNLRVNSGAPTPNGLVFVSPTATFTAAELLDQFLSTNLVETDCDDPLIIDPGQSVLVTATVSNASNTVSAIVAWSES